MAVEPPVVIYADHLYELATSDLTAAEIRGVVKSAGSVDAAATQSGLSPAVLTAAVQLDQAPPEVQSRQAPAKPLETLGDVFSLLAGIGVLVLVLGGLILAMRLRSADLPPEAVFAQLPRDFLITIGTSQVLAPALVVVALHALLRGLMSGGRSAGPVPLAVGAAIWLAVLILVLLAAAGRVFGVVSSRNLDPASLPIAIGVLVIAVVAAAAVRSKWSDPAGGWRWRHGPDWLTLSIVYGVVAMIAATFVAATFPLLEARACMSSGFGENGDLVGQGSDRIFLGESVTPPRRIVSFGDI